MPPFQWMPWGQGRLPFSLSTTGEAQAHVVSAAFAASRERQRDVANPSECQTEIYESASRKTVEFALIQEMSRYCSAKSPPGEKDLPCKSMKAGEETYLQSPLLSVFHPAELRICISSFYSVYCSSWRSNKTDFQKCWGILFKQ